MARKRTNRRAPGPESIVLRDTEGRTRLFLGLLGSDEAPTIQLNDADGRPRATIQVDADGRAVVSLQGAGGEGLIGLGASEAGEIGLSINRAGGLPVLSLNWSEAEGLRLSVWGHAGQIVWQPF